MASPKVIGTHNGCFHADEVLAIVLLKFLPEFKDMDWVRTRDPEVLKTCHIVVDVGGEFDPAALRFDHHQRSFEATMNSVDASNPWKTKLSSAGLIYAHYGKEVLKVLLKCDPKHHQLLFEKMYVNFVEEFDGVDNGVLHHDGESRYKIGSTIGARVNRLVPSWNDTTGDYDGQFAKALEMVKGEFLDVLHGYENAWIPARDVLETAFETRMDVDPSGEVLILGQSCPWKGHLYAIEGEMAAAGTKVEIKYVLYPDNSGKWRVQCVSINENSFTNRLSLPEPWCGIRDQALSDLSGIPGCIFVHANGFIGGNATKEGALAMVKASLAFAR